MPRPHRPFALASLALALAACSHGRNPAPSLDIGAVTFDSGTLVYLDTTLRVVFDAGIDPSTVTPASTRLAAIEGPGVGTAAVGMWRVNGNAIEFEPQLPMGEPLLTSGGLQPDTTYELEVLGGDLPDAVRTMDGRWLAGRVRYEFATRAGYLPQHVFEHNRFGPPTLLDVTPSPRDGEGRWRLGSGAQPAELRLEFDQPLDPGIANLPRAPTALARGPIALVYDDVVYGANTWVAADVELIRNVVSGATVVVRPRGVLPSAARVRLSVAGELRDLFGEARGAIDPEPVRDVTTEPAFEPQSDALFFEFGDATRITAPGAEPGAVVVDGALTVPEAFPEMPDIGDWSPNGISAVLRTDQQTLHYGNGKSRTFEGGVLHMKNLHIGVGQVVRGIGPNPLVLVVDGDATIDGELTVRGVDGQSLLWGQYRGPGDVPPPAGGGALPPMLPVGPAAGAGGGRGGATRAAIRESLGAPGASAPGTTGGGGRGGAPVRFNCEFAPGGGGGGGAVQGDPWFPSPAGPGDLFPQRAGRGGAGCDRTLAGGAAGSPWFTNASLDDDFWGRAYVPQRRLAILGELARPVGGSGGGSGGSMDANQGVSFGSDGGDGGGGGGAIVLQVRGTLTIGSHGRVDADGGAGRGGIFSYPPSPGGGGGGAGGMVVLMAGDGIVIHTKGETFANRDYDFVISADGGVCRSTSSGPPYIPGKYPLNGQTVFAGSTYDSVPLGGFGGMGLVQLMVPVGVHNHDGTNTVLDDAITIVRNGVPLRGAEKQRYLGWGGFPDDDGIYVDDFGVPIATRGGQGDIRPDPVLMPVPFATHGKARARSEWLPLGALHRRSIAAPDGSPRGVVGDNLTFEPHARPDGWLPFGLGRLAAEAGGPGLLPAPAAIASIARDDGTFGRPTYAVELTAPLPLTQRNAYAGRLAVLQHISGGAWGRGRVLANTERRLYLATEGELPPNAPHVQLFAWGADLASGEPGSYVGAGNTLLPRANARIGFAFHRDADAAIEGFDPQRYPPGADTFLFDLSEPATRAALRTFGPRYLQWDVTIDGEFATSSADRPPRADGGSRLALRRIALPLRY